MNVLRTTWQILWSVDALLLVLAASLFRDFRSVVAGRLAVALALGSAAHAVTSAIGAPSPVSIWHAPLIALSVQGKIGKRTEDAANALARIVVADTTAPYVGTKIATYESVLRTTKKQLASINIRLAA